MACSNTSATTRQNARISGSGKLCAAALTKARIVIVDDAARIACVGRGFRRAGLFCAFRRDLRRTRPGGTEVPPSTCKSRLQLLLDRRLVSPAFIQLTHEPNRAGTQAAAHVVEVGL